MKRKLRSPGETSDEAEGGVPVGTILDFAGVTPPSGFLLANGAAGAVIRTD